MLQGMNILYENNSLVHYYFPIVQWGTYPGSGGTIRYPVSFTSKVFAVISSSSLNFNATDINNLAYWTTTDTNIGNNWKTSGWYLAMGK